MDILKYLQNNSKVFEYFIKEFKLKIFYSVLTIILTSISCYIYIKQLIYLITFYLLDNMYTNRFIFTQLTEVFFTYFKFSIFCGILFSLPIIFFFIWLFFIPGLYNYERKYINWYCLLIFVLLIVSILLNYYFILPNILKFFLYFEQNNMYFPIHFEAKLSNYLFSIVLLLLNITLCFQIPAILSFLLYFNIVKVENLIKKRKYIYITFILISALISPPDLYNQILLSFFIIFFYELFIFLLFFFKNFFFHS
jgi:sec-independent protein translocase protein TatC